MISPYLEKEEIETLNELLAHAGRDTLSCWVSTRINGASASLACEGNVSIPLLNLMDSMILPLVEKARRSPYQEGLDRVATTPQPKEQKFLIGSRVRIAQDLGPLMGHFPGKGCEATVKYTHAHAFGGSPKSYSLDVDGHGSCSWYEEHQLTLIDDGDKLDKKEW